jgi:hypothetical protein
LTPASPALPGHGGWGTGRPPRCCSVLSPRLPRSLYPCTALSVSLFLIMYHRLHSKQSMTCRGARGQGAEWRCRAAAPLPLPELTRCCRPLLCMPVQVAARPIGSGGYREACRRQSGGDEGLQGRRTPCCGDDHAAALQQSSGATTRR